MKNRILFILIFIFFLSIKISLWASNEDLFFHTKEFNTHLENAQLSQEKYTPITGNISFATPKGHVEFKYILDINERINTFDTPFSHFSTNEEFLEDVLQYYILKSKYYPLEIKSLKHVNKKRFTRNDTIYLKLNDVNEINDRGRENINILVYCIKEINAQYPNLNICNNEAKFVKDICVYRYFSPIKKRYCGIKNGIFKVFLSHENKNMLGNIPEVQSLREMFKLISLWIFEDLKIKIAKETTNRIF